MIETQLLKGNLIKQEHSLAFTLNQYDKNISYKINLIGVNGNGYTLDSSDVVTIEWQKPNGQPFLQTSNIVKGDTYITLLTPEAISQIAGTGSYNIIITNGDTRKGTIKREYSVIANSMRNGTSSEDMITDVVTELRELSATLTETVQNNQDLINNNQAATKQDIANVNSSLEEKANKSDIGSPLIANTVAEMVDTTKVYVYTGSETGYTNGNWYSYNGTSWISGGTYNSQGIGDKEVTYEKLSDDVRNLFSDVGGVYEKGLAYDSSLTSTLPISTLYIPDKSLNYKGVIKKIKLNVQNTCTAKLLVLKKNSDTSFTILSITDLYIEIGEKEYDVDIEIPESGLYFGIKASIYYGSGLIGENCSGFYESSSTLTVGSDIVTKKDTGAENKQFGIQFDIFQVGTFRKELDELKNKISNQTDLKILNMPHYLLEENKDTTFLFNCYYLGRWIKKTYNGVNYMYTINHGSEIFAKVSNTTTITMKFGDNCNSNGTKHVFAYSVDGGEFIRDTVDKGTVTISGLDTKEHYIRIVVAGIADQNWLWTVDQGFYFGGLEVDTDGIIEPVRPKNRIAYFYGDSITAGCWLLGANDGVNNVTIPVNAAEQNYVMECCNRLNLMNVRIGFSGSGVLTTGQGSVPKCIEWIDKLNNYTNEDTQDKPDFICINLGQNDSDTGFKVAYQECVDRLQRKYPGVLIFIIVPFSQKHRTDLIDISNTNKNTVLIDTQGWNISLNDSAHPNKAGSIVAGNNLSSFLLSYFGKSYFML